MVISVTVGAEISVYRDVVALYNHMKVEIHLSSAHYNSFEMMNSMISISENASAGQKSKYSRIIPGVLEWSRLTKDGTC